MFIRVNPTIYHFFIIKLHFEGVFICFLLFTAPPSRVGLARSAWWGGMAVRFYGASWCGGSVVAAWWWFLLDGSGGLECGIVVGLGQVATVWMGWRVGGGGMVVWWIYLKDQSTWTFMISPWLLDSMFLLNLREGLADAIKWSSNVPDWVEVRPWV